jgi:hypothetical protein
MCEELVTIGGTSAGQTVLDVRQREDISTSGGNTVWSVSGEESDIGFGGGFQILLGN